jgi:hypothetical protein
VAPAATSADVAAEHRACIRTVRVPNDAGTHALEKQIFLHNWNGYLLRRTL